MNIFESITKIMEEIPAIKKDKTNTTQNFKFRGIDDVMNVLHPLLSKYKVFIVPQVLEHKREERVTSKGVNLIYSICKTKYIFYAEDGTSVEAITEGEGMDSGDKSTNKAMAVAMKYALFQVFCIPTDEMIDPDSESYEPSKPKTDIEESTISAKISEALRDAIKNNNVSNDNVIKVLGELKHNKLLELKVNEVNKFKEMLGIK